MNDAFFDWLDECPCQWVLEDSEDGKYRTYRFIDNEEEEEEE